MEDVLIDEAFVQLSEHLKALANIRGTVCEDEEAGFSTRVERIKAEMPVELDVRVEEDGTVNLGSTPPVYYANTSLQPVFHYMKITITEDNS